MRMDMTQSPNKDLNTGASRQYKPSASGQSTHADGSPGTPARNVATSAVLAALALIFSYIEVLIPFQPGLPGVKLGLANLVVIVCLYRMNAKYALTINIIRVIVAGLLFTGLWGLVYSLAGSLLSFAVMYLLKKTNLFSVIGVSMAGGVAHNLGQLLIAAFAVSTASLLYYFPILIVSGMVAGLIIGIADYILIRRIPASVLPANQFKK